MLGLVAVRFASVTFLFWFHTNIETCNDNVIYVFSFIFPFSVKSDTSNHIIRRIVISSGLVSTIAGISGTSGSADGLGTSALFQYPRGIAMDAIATVALIVSDKGRAHNIMLGR